MPVRKYRCVSEMKGPLPGKPLEGRNLEQAFELMETAGRLSPVPYPPGVHRFRSLEEANRYRAAVETAFIRRRKSEP